MERQNFRIPAWDNFSQDYEETEAVRSPRFHIKDLLRVKEELKLNEQRVNNITVDPSCPMIPISPMSRAELSTLNNEDQRVMTRRRKGRRNQIKNLKRMILQKKIRKKNNRVKSQDHRKALNKGPDLSGQILEAHQGAIISLMKVFLGLNKYSAQNCRIPDSAEFINKFKHEIRRLEEFSKNFSSPKGLFPNVPDIVENFIKSFYRLRYLHKQTGRFKSCFISRCRDSSCFSKEKIGKICIRAHGNQRLRNEAEPISFNQIYQIFKHRLNKAQKHIQDLENEIKTNSEIPNLVEELKKKLKKSGIKNGNSLLSDGDEITPPTEENKEISKEVQVRLKYHEARRAKPRSYPPSMINKRKIKHCGHCCLGYKQKCFLERYFHKHHNFLEALEKLLVCPITMEMIKKPTIIPSGNLVEESVVQRLIKDGKTDPFNRRLRLQKVIPDRFAYAVLNLFINNHKF
ncbi:unnamed protein product [Moneuplotes crassus]|uniref:U-box domain-containing protein n=1 Tax=Euplotes crassus TaxID=5936 RepID=A0AAD1X5P8_EUPCR|nr:unnamed protein product [Moneuplotes crassus]